jgi:hypothetical protein
LGAQDSGGFLPRFWRGPPHFPGQEIHIEFNPGQNCPAIWKPTNPGCLNPSHRFSPGRALPTSRLLVGPPRLSLLLTSRRRSTTIPPPSAPTPRRTSTRRSAHPSRWSGVGCPHRRPAPVLAPRSAPRGSRARGSSPSPSSEGVAAELLRETVLAGTADAALMPPPPPAAAAGIVGVRLATAPLCQSTTYSSRPLPFLFS